jgi:hypothetical protein
VVSSSRPEKMSFSDRGRLFNLDPRGFHASPGESL